jgi:hypothetical protein
MVVPLLRLCGEGHCAALPVDLREGLRQCAHRLMHHMAVQLSEALTSPDSHTWKHINRSDAAIRDRSQMRGVLLVHLHLASNGETARYPLHHDSLNLYANAPLGVGRDLDYVVALGTAVAAFVGRLRIGSSLR